MHVTSFWCVGFKQKCIFVFVQISTELHRYDFNFVQWKRIVKKSVRTAERGSAKGHFSDILVRKTLSCCASVSLVPLEYVFIIAGMHLSVFNALLLFSLADRHYMKSKE